MPTFFRHSILIVAVMLLLGHNIIAHRHGCEIGGIHTQDLFHQLGDFFGIDLGAGHMTATGESDTGLSTTQIPLQPPILPPVLLAFEPVETRVLPLIIPMPHSGNISSLPGYGNAWGLRGPPTLG